MTSATTNWGGMDAYPNSMQNSGEASKTNGADTRLMLYQARRVNELLHINESRKLSLDELALECGDLVTKYGVQNSVAVSRLHHHYELKDNQRVVLTTVEASKSRREDTAQTNGLIIVKTPRDAQDGDVPYIFGFDSEGAVVPLEYISKDAADGKLATKIQAMMEPVLSNREFLSELFEKYQSQGNVKQFGFQAIFEDDVLPPPSEDGMELYEDNWLEYQEVSYRKQEKDQDATVTSWRFKEGAPMHRAFCDTRIFCVWVSETEHLREARHVRVG